MEVLCDGNTSQTAKTKMHTKSLWKKQKDKIKIGLKEIELM
jgi:hypothetical protein